jgi:RNA polymerase sigma factor (sigma-70 family)
MARKDVRLNESERQMVEDNLAFVTYVAKRHFSKFDYIKNQDIFQEGAIAMINAMPKYDPTKAKLTTYMFPTINGHLIRFCQYRDKIIPIPHQKYLKQVTKDKADLAKFILSLDKKYADIDGAEECTLLNILPGEDSFEELTVNKICITDAIKQLEWKERLVITYRYYFDLNQTMIGTLMGISQVHVHRLEKRALGYIKDYLLKD